MYSNMYVQVTPSEPSADSMNKALGAFRGYGKRFMDSPATANKYSTRGACCRTSLLVIVMVGSLRSNPTAIAKSSAAACRSIAEPRCPFLGLRCAE